MATIYTYDSLFTKILQYLERDDEETVAQITDFIMLATRRVSTDSKSLGLKNYVYAHMTAEQYLLPKPGNWLNTSTITIVNLNGEEGPNNPTYGQKFPLEIVSYSFCELYAPDPTVLGQPAYYADFDYYNWYIAPTPDYAYPVIIGFYQNDIPINEILQTNFLISNAPQLMLKASLLEAQFYVKDKGMIPIWQQEYHDLLAKFNLEDSLRVSDSFARRSME